jgi:pimeloyl-ACP methyl ester carboxylesterase
MDERRIDLDGEEFRFLERPGSGPVLLFLHGLGDSADQFEPVGSRLPDGWRLLALDQRGHGGSWKPEEGYSPIDFARDAARYLEALGLEAAHLFGHSMGGRNALALAAFRPGQVRSLVLGDIGMEEDPKDIEATTRFFSRLPESFSSEEEARAHWRKRKPGYPDEMLEILMRNLEEAEDGNLRWRFSEEACIASVTAARSRPWWDMCPRVACPSLLLHAESSTELSDEVAAQVRAEVPGIRYARVPDSGHNFHMENPEFAAAEIRAFVEEVEAG